MELPKVIFMEATPALMEPHTLEKVRAAGVILYRKETNDCHTVVSHLPDGAGYAQIQRQGRSYKLHLISWCCATGPLPDGNKVLQTCGNRACINPEHLISGTVTEMRQEARKGKMPEGEVLTPAPLTPEDKNLIRRLIHYGASRRTISLSFGISRTAVNQLRQEGLGLATES